MSESPQTDLRMLFCDEVLAVAARGSVCIVLWRGAVTYQLFELQREALAAVVKQHATGAALLCVIANTSQPPEEAVRRASVEMVQGHRRQLPCVACVVEGKGFKAAAHRAVLSGMAMLLDKAPGQQIGVFASVDDAAPWVSKLMKLAPSVRLAQDVVHMRDRMLRAAS